MIDALGEARKAASVRGGHRDQPRHREDRERSAQRAAAKGPPPPMTVVLAAPPATTTVVAAPPLRAPPKAAAAPCARRRRSSKPPDRNAPACEKPRRPSRSPPMQRLRATAQDLSGGGTSRTRTSFRPRPGPPTAAARHRAERHGGSGCRLLRVDDFLRLPGRRHGGIGRTDQGTTV